MLLVEYTLTNADEVVDYIEAARAFGFQYKVEKIARKRWHMTIYTDKLIKAAQDAAKEE